MMMESCLVFLFECTYFVFVPLAHSPNSLMGKSFLYTYMSYQAGFDVARVS